MPKSSIKEIKKLHPSVLLRVINKAKKHLKKDGLMQATFKEYGVDIEEIDLIPTYFKDLDVSAKTDHAIVWLNYKLLLDGFDLKDCSYLIHEYTHYLQQTCGTKPTKGSDDGNYLDNEFEQEAFQDQVEYIAKHLGEDEAEDYVDHLLDYHDVDSNKEYDDKKEALMSKIASALINTLPEAMSFLQLSPEASLEEIKAKYKLLARQYHPDIIKDDGLKMKMLNAAYEIATNKQFSTNEDNGPINEDNIPTTKIDMSYEDIAKYRGSMGREEFEEEHPGWTSELKIEMGLDQYNSIFEGYSNNSEESEELTEEYNKRRDEDTYEAISELIEGIENSFDDNPGDKEMLVDHLGDLLNANSDQIKQSYPTLKKYDKREIQYGWNSVIDNALRRALKDLPDLSYALKSNNPKVRHSAIVHATHSQLLSLVTEPIDYIRKFVFDRLLHEFKDIDAAIQMTKNENGYLQRSFKSALQRYMSFEELNQKLKA